MWRRGLAIADAAPERYITLTLVGKIGETWPVMRGRMKRLRYAIAEDLGAVQWGWSIEHNPQGTGYHVNAYQRGDFLPQARLSELADSVGMGYRVWIEALRASSHYGMKEALGYGMKEAAAQSQGDAYLRLNGGRLTHSSRGFFDGGVRAAEARGVARARAAGDAQTWELVTVSELHDARPVAPRLSHP